MSIFRRLRFWYLRRFHGHVAAPGGTTWQEHRTERFERCNLPCVPFRCTCGERQHFTEKNYVVRARDPETEQVIDARYVLICSCGIGHWMNATPRREK
jgi:hypothetical protein